MQNCDFTCLLIIEVCGVLYHNSSIQDLVDLSINSIKRILKKIFIPHECAPEVAKVRK